MTGLAVTGWSALCGAGIGAAALVDAVRAGRRPTATAVAASYEDPLPTTRGNVVVDFAVRDQLGRKGTSLFDRWTAFSVATCDMALRDGDVRLGLMRRERVGLVLGTTVGGLKSTSDFSRDTLTQHKPYMVTPSLFPNTVMNCGAGQSAIWFGLKGVNATLAGGKLAFPQALRYAGTLLRRGYADMLLTGAVEELTAHSAWMTHLTAPQGMPGEGAAVFVVERASDARAGGRHVEAEILAVATGYCSGEHSADALIRALATCAGTALLRADVVPDQVEMVAAGGAEVDVTAAVTALGRTPTVVIAVDEWLGECQAASAGLQLAMVLASHRLDPARDGSVSLLTAHTADGGVAAWVIRGWHRGDPDHR